MFIYYCALRNLFSLIRFSYDILLGINDFKEKIIKFESKQYEKFADELETYIVWYWQKMYASKIVCMFTVRHVCYSLLQCDCANVLRFSSQLNALTIGCRTFFLSYLFIPLQCEFETVYSGLPSRAEPRVFM